MLKLQQLYLFVDPAGVSGQAAVCADHTVAGNYYGDLVMTDGAAYRLSGQFRKPIFPAFDAGFARRS